jgi:hypothetical protein
MSGSPCIGPSGEAIGLHEAGFEIQQNGEKFSRTAPWMRAMCCRTFSRGPPSCTLAPLASATDYGIYDPALRLGWASADKCWPAPRMQRVDAGRSNIGDPEPASGGAVREFHPLFKSGAHELVAWPAA